MKTEYQLELYDTTCEPRPIARINSGGPFIAMNVGDHLDDTGWDRLDAVGRIASPENPIRYVVHSIKHQIEQHTDRLLLKYCLNLKPHKGARSPVWGEM
jgi:hypothetical protein